MGCTFSNLNVSLQSGELLDEIVVIGYSPVSRKKVLGALASVDEEQIYPNLQNLFNKMLLDEI